VQDDVEESAIAGDGEGADPSSANEARENQPSNGPEAPAPGSGVEAPPPPEVKVEAGWYPDPDSANPDELRYWDGDDWTDHRSVPDGPSSGTGVGVVHSGFSTTPIGDDERRQLLAQQIQQAAARGLRVESQDRYQAILIEGHPVNHTLHAILTIFTCLLWGIVWAVIAATGGEKRHLVTVDEYGNVTHQNLGKG
jgi:hypothetical protein